MPHKRFRLISSIKLSYAPLKESFGNERLQRIKYQKIILEMLLAFIDEKEGFNIKAKSKD